MHIIQFDLWETNFVSAPAQKFAIQRGKKPRLRFRAVAQLVALGRPKKKRLLGQIGRVGFRLRQAEGKTKQRRVLPIYQLLKIDRAHITTVPVAAGVPPATGVASEQSKVLSRLAKCRS